MRIEIEIPKEFEGDYNGDKFKEFFSRVLCDIDKGVMCGAYEKETAEMLLKAFDESEEAYDPEAVVSELTTLEFDIYDSSERRVMCIRNDEDGMMISSENHHLLEIGKEYTVVDVEVHSWYTLVWLAEFPEKTFNSVVFSEIPRKEQHESTDM